MANILGGFGSAVIGVVHFMVYGRRRQASQSSQPDEAVEAQIDEGEAADEFDTAESGASPTETLVLDAPQSAGATIVSPVSPASTFGPETDSESAPPPAWLVFQTGPNAGQTIPLASGGTRVGRGSENDIVIADDGVSRQHAEITFVDGQYCLTDVGSSGGTLVEGSQAQEAVPLESGATLRLGSTDVLFMQGSPTGSAPDAPTEISDSTPAPAPAAPAAPAGGAAAQTMVASAAPEPTTVMAWLAVVEGPSKGVTYQVKVGANTIGRDTGNDLVLSDSDVSRHHALVVAEDDKLTLFDVSSSGATELNGRKSVPASLSTTSQIKVGDTVLMMVDVDPAQSAAPPATSGSTDATMVGVPAPPQAGGVLIVQSGPDSGKTFQLVEGDNVIGRSEGTILLTDPLVSRRHAVIRRSTDRFIIYDLGSVAGTIVDGQEVKGDELKGGDKIVLGGATIVVMDPLSVQS
ncbi:MAG: FHA domain-containing protein [Dehalococcoidia bacterium]|jgi:pSer/pThr/pTyr-binding forkhead associated (FHA) protein|nr:FHA domain-containing protein [Dehalococcoidia bacterium]